MTTIASVRPDLACDPVAVLESAFTWAPGARPREVPPGIRGVPQAAPVSVAPAAAPEAVLDCAVVRVLVAVTRETGLDGRLPGRDVVRAQIRELSGYLDALRTTAATANRGRADGQMWHDAAALLARTPDVEVPTIRQAGHLRQLARVTSQFLDLFDHRREAP